MAINTYGTLKAAIASWLERSDLTAVIPDFITMGESQINLDLKCRDNEKRITASVSTEYFDIPTNFIEMRNMQLNTDPIQHLNYVSPEQMDQYQPNSTTGQPKVYSIHGKEFQIKPIPDSAYTVEMTYWHRLTGMAADSDSNTVLTNYPSLYLYASLISAEGYTDSENIKKWMALYDRIIKKINSTDRIGRFSGTKLYSKPRQVPE